jgi:hypothetical protein
MEILLPAALHCLADSIAAPQLHGSYQYVAYCELPLTTLTNSCAIASSVC